ncbi:MAG: hypothetical protein HN509_06100 [Halobacteriovoraceae bacterium]|nr:hypothetical protein [Halobacteriovoraceae bacterium]MBT5093551.1 hypothetical protein [Halobacteriovoraceae bacterium]
MKYLGLVEKHLRAREKFYGLFFRADPRQKEKLERLFYSSLKEIREFESSLGEEDKTRFESWNNGLKVDSTYSENHELAFDAASVAEGVFSDPHYLASQEEANYAEDNEESSGSIEDYLSYKGLS